MDGVADAVDNGCCQRHPGRLYISLACGIEGIEMELEHLDTPMGHFDRRCRNTTYRLDSLTIRCAQKLVSVKHAVVGAGDIFKSRKVSEYFLCHELSDLFVCVLKPDEALYAGKPCTS